MTQNLPVTEGLLAGPHGSTWYQVFGELGTGSTPVVGIHGGPGSTHDYLAGLERLGAGSRAVVLYDQLGNGRSTHLPDKPADFWTVELFLAELDALLHELGIADDYVLLGQSWGGMLAAEHAVLPQPGLRGLILADSPAAMPLWRAAAHELRRTLPISVAAALDRHEAAGTFDDPGYEAASLVYNQRFVVRMPVAPVSLLATLKAMHDDPTVYRAMNGPTDFHVIGSLRDWSVIDRLERIEVPTLVLRGEFDEATQETVQPFLDLIPRAEAAVLAGASHLPHLEQPEAFFSVVLDFLDRL